ncbi:hypothetical protein [Thalassobius sp. Cn5-15]|uniref:hypothetical protein n=1 Tax=Thalassobius sp. Cn5-15 TaxID=2917763 RepID=UPI001EF2740F|nr:hypothetical protein [Thalassobius sp. Cn5-15]MCG7492869.1 hypothetical protein [Thalassobius sp. Cn5-15]
MEKTPLITNLAPDISPMLLSVITMLVMVLPIFVALSALLRLRESTPPRASWSCLVAAVLLFLSWLMPPVWVSDPVLRAFRDFAALVFYGWMLLDWFRTGRDHGWSVVDLLVMALIVAMIALTGWAVLI